VGRRAEGGGGRRAARDGRGSRVGGQERPILIFAAQGPD
jgi:hypothetical protein